MYQLCSKCENPYKKSSSRGIIANHHKETTTRRSTKNVKQLKLSIEPDDGIVNKKIKEEFNLKNATIYGGYNLFSDYLAFTGLDRLLEEEFAGMKAPWARYSMPIVCRTLIDGYALGLRNIYQFEGIESDPLISAKHACRRMVTRKRPSYFSRRL